MTMTHHTFFLSCTLGTGLWAVSYMATDPPTSVVWGKEVGGRIVCLLVLDHFFRNRKGVWTAPRTWDLCSVPGPQTAHTHLSAKEVVTQVGLAGTDCASSLSSSRPHRVPQTDLFSVKVKPRSLEMAVPG